MTYVVAILIFGVLLSICVAGYIQSSREAEKFSDKRKQSSSPSKSPPPAEKRS